MDANGPVEGLTVYIHAEGSIFLPNDTIDIVYTDENGEFESINDLESPIQAFAIYTGMGCSYFNNQVVDEFPYENYYTITCSSNGGGNPGGGSDGLFDCFEVVMPVDVIYPDGMLYTITESSDLDSLGASFVQFVFPIEIEYEDESVVTINNFAELYDAQLDCEESQFDCFSLFYPAADSILDGIVTFINDSQGDDLEYFWNFGDGSTSTEPYPSHVYESETDEYYVCLTVSNSSCSHTSCVWISGNMDDPAGSGISTGSSVERQGTAKSDGFEFVVLPASEGPLNIDDSKIEVGMNIYPNPSDGLIKVELDNTTNLEGVISIADLGGRIIFQKNVGQTKTEILDLDALPKGVYILQYNGHDSVGVQKIVLQ